MHVYCYETIYACTHNSRCMHTHKADSVSSFSEKHNIRGYKSVSVHKYIMYVCIHADTRSSIYACIFGVYLDLVADFLFNTHASMHTAHTQTNMHTHTHARTYTRTHTRTHTHTHTPAHAHTHTHARTHASTHPHTLKTWNLTYHKAQMYTSTCSYAIHQIYHE